MKNHKRHYGWIVLAMGVFVVAASLGFDRFGYAAILPSMQEGLKLSDAQVGIIGSANVFGYLVAAMGVGFLASRYGPRLMITLSMFWMALSMVILSFASNFALIVFLRFLTGIGGAGGNISIVGLVSGWFSQNRRGLANGILVGGSGIAIATTGWFVPLVNKVYEVDGWRYNWFIIGIIIGIIGLLATYIIRNSPRDKCLSPIGYSLAGPIPEAEEKEKMSIKDISKLEGIRTLLVIYFCFGMSYVIYGTFFVNFLVAEKGFTEIVVGNIWSTAGLLSIGSAIIWGSLSDFIGRQFTLAIIFVLQAVSYIIPAVAGTNITLLWLSAIIFGLVAWSIPAVVASYCGDLVGPINTPATLGLVTVFFGLGQVLGPVSAGVIKELSNSYAGAFVLAAVLAALGAVTLILTGKINQDSNPDKPQVVGNF